MEHGPTQQLCHLWNQNHNTATQIDFLAVRKIHADALARQAQPIALDLSPWRAGPKHAPVKASVPLIAGWKLKRQSRNQVSFCREALTSSLQHPTEHTFQFRNAVREAVIAATSSGQPISALNTRLLQLCQQYYPAQTVSRMRPGEDPAVTAGVRRMWQLHRALKRKTAGTALQRIFTAWIKYGDFMRAWRALRAVSRDARKRWLEDQKMQAETAAEKHDMRGVFRVIQRVAPKRKMDQVRVRGVDGKPLTKNSS